jgi:hypothetical protein
MSIPADAVPTLKITIGSKKANHWPIVVEQRLGKDFPSTVWRGQLELDWNDLLANQIEQRLYGTLLGQAVFKDSIYEAFIIRLNRK